MAVVSDEHIVNPNGIPGLDDAAQYGFVVPIKWYVTKSNISEIHDAIPNGLHANYNGGFSVAPLLTSPYCTVNEAKSAAPSADESGRLHQKSGSAEDFEAVVVVPGGAEAFVFDADLLGLVVFEQA